MAKFRRLSSAELRQAVKRDEVREGLVRFVAWLKSRVENVVIGGIALLVLVFLAVFFVRNRGQGQVKASELVTQAAMDFSQDAAQGASSQDRARARYQEILSAYPGSAAARQAELGLAQCDLEEGKIDPAASQYADFVLRHPGDPLAPLAAAGAAYCLEAKGRYAEAAAAFSAVADHYPQAPNLAQSFLDAARNYGLAGDGRAKARMLEQAVKAGVSGPSERNKG
jgi:outer membrane protein assembly factor BamD (BamD/ComL family)